MPEPTRGVEPGRRLGGVAWGVRELSADAKSLIWQRPVWARVAGEFGWARQVR